MGKRPAQRHFPYQHPTFGTDKNPKPVSAWKDSLYYWWWAYLRKNTDYIQCCESGGEGPMAEIYKDFGDVRGESFKAWWTEEGRGVRLFADPRSDESFRLLGEGEPAPSHKDGLTLVLPLGLPKRFLSKRFKELLDKHHKGKQGYQYARSSNAKYKFEGQPNRSSLALTLIVYEYRHAFPKKKLWEIGNEIPDLLRTQKIKPSHNKHEVNYRKRVLAITVKRYLKRAEESIRRVGIGLSP